MSSNRWFLYSVIFILSTGFWNQINAQNNFDDVQIKSTKLTNNSFMLEGAGGNIGLILGEDGAFIIDDQYAPLSDKIQKKITELSGKSVKYVINTHWHGDHTGGNENFGKQGALIIAHKNVRERLSQEQKRGDNTTPPAPEIAWPVITFGEDMQIHIDGKSIILIHVHNAHTDGDALVWLPEENVLHMGDCFFHKRFPYIDLDSGGSVDGVIKANEAALMIVDDNTKIVPGHGPLATKADLVKNLEFLRTVKLRILEYTNAGRSAEMMRAEEIVKGYEDWTWGFIDAARITSIFAKSLANK